LGEAGELKSEPATDDDYLVAYGGEIKALGDGRVGGYLVVFGSPDDTDITEQRDFFTKDTDFGFDDRDTIETDIYYHHGLDAKIGKRRLGRGTLKVDDVGVWVEAQLKLRDEYERAVYDMAQKKKQGWSSGTAPHLVARQRVGSANKILSWPLGLDASITPTPAEPKTLVLSLKSLGVTDEITEGNASLTDTDTDTTGSVDAEGATAQSADAERARRLRLELDLLGL
jgi:hypothetical protein